MAAPLEPDVLGGPHVWFLVLSRVRAERVHPNVPHIVISITDPDRPNAVLPPAPLRMAVLRLKFDDVEAPEAWGSPPTADHARQIVDFVRKFGSMADLIVCHCEQGISRSAGTAAALCRWLNGHDEEFFQRFLPNRLIYRLILNELGHDGVILPGRQNWP